MEMKINNKHKNVSVLLKYHVCMCAFVPSTGIKYSRGAGAGPL